MIKKILSLGGATAHRRSASTIGAFSSKDGNAKEDVDLKNECRFLVGISLLLDVLTISCGAASQP